MNICVMLLVLFSQVELNESTPQGKESCEERGTTRAVEEGAIRDLSNHWGASEL